MVTPILATKLYIPPPQPNGVPRPRLIKQLEEGLHRKLTLVSAPAGFGKTTLIREWAHSGIRARGYEQRTVAETSTTKYAWLSLDEGDNDPVRFLTYLIAALQTVEANLGGDALSILQSPQAPPPVEGILTALINDVADPSPRLVLALDDYHLVENPLVHEALTFLLEHLPPQFHLVIATREDPPFPLARYRARGQLSELRAADLRFTPAEAAVFLNTQVDLKLSAEDIAALERRTEGWIAGLHLAALALQSITSTQNPQDINEFIQSFTGSHRYVLDYLIEEVLERQPEKIQTFLLRTSILDRLCGSLCDAVLKDAGTRSSTSSASGQETLEYLERANLFIVPLDDERCWYRYHHLFADLLRQRLQQKRASPAGDEGVTVAKLHRRASIWYEENGLALEAFRHAAAAHDVERAARLVEGRGASGAQGIPLHFRGAVAPVLNWLASLPKATLDARPSLWVMYASALSMTGQLTGVEEKLQAAEAALQDHEPFATADDKIRNLVGHIAAIRALLAVTQHEVETIISQSHRALEYLHPDNLAVRTATTWKLGIAYQLRGKRTAASRAYADAIAASRTSGNTIIETSATLGLGSVQESQNQLQLAAETYRRFLQLVGDQPQPIAGEAHLGLARIHYQWNELEAAQRHGEQSVQMVQRVASFDTFASCKIFFARLKLAREDMVGATAEMTEAKQFLSRHTFVQQIREVAAAHVRVLIHQGKLRTAADLAETHDLPISRARVHLARGDASAALTALEPWRQQVIAKDWKDDVLRATILQALAWQTEGQEEKALRLLGEALARAAPGGFIRLFVDEGPPMAHLLSKAATRGMAPEYTEKLLAAFPDFSKAPATQHEIESREVEMIDPLTPRELEVLQLIVQGLSNREIGERLFIALSTVKGHTQNIYGKLQVHRRTEAVARARELGLM